MCSSICHVLVIVVIVSSFSLIHSSRFEFSTIRNASVIVSNNGTSLSSVRLSDNRNRTVHKVRGQPGVLPPVLKKRQRLKRPEHMADQQPDLQQLPPAVNSSMDGKATLESDIQLRRSLRQKKRKLKRLWQEIDRIQRALRAMDGRQRNNAKLEADDGKVKLKMKNRKSHWRRRMMQRLKLLSRQLQEQQKAPSLDTVEKLYTLLAMEQLEAKTGNAGIVRDRDGPRVAGRRSKKHRGHGTKRFNVTVSPRAKEAYANADIGNKTIQLHQHGRKTGAGGPKMVGKTGSMVSVGRTILKKGEAGSACTSHKNCKPGLCCHQSTVLTLSVNATGNICVEHRLKQGQPCANSCQCDSGLQCFISRKDKLHHKRLSPPDSSPWSSSSKNEGSDGIMVPIGTFASSNDGQCKVPAMDDVLHGTYIIGENALFKSNH